jgi:error-prone DNA polymerase
MTIAHLHAQSHFSFGHGTASPDALCAAAARQGVEALALTDLDGLYGVPEFLAAAARHGIHAVVGASLPDPSLPRSQNRGRAVLLARDPAGYAELCRLLTRRHAAPHTPLLRLLETCSEHLWLLTPDFSLLKAIRRVRGPDYLLAELRAGAGWERLAEEASVLGVPSVGTAAVQLADASDRRFQRLLAAVHRQVPFARIRAMDLASERGWMLDEGAMRAAFSRWPEASVRALDVARDCRIGELSSVPLQRRSEAAAGLRHRVVEVARSRFGDPLPEEVRDRLDRELEVLCQGARPAAMNLVAELASYAREQGLPIQATSPASGSLVAWCLDLVPDEPLRARLPFAPLCNDRADGVLRLDLRTAPAACSRLIERLRRELGDDRVAAPGRIERWDLREAVRDVARSAALAASEQERVLRQLPPGWRGEGPDELVARYPRLRGAGLEQAPWDRILRAAARLAGAPRGLARGSGVLIDGGPVGDRAPLQSVDGRPTAQWERSGAASLGMLTLELPDDRAAAIELRTRGQSPTQGPVPVRTPELEPLLAELRAGRTIGCPGLEEPRIRASLRRHEVADLDDLLRVVADASEQAFAERRVAVAAELAGLDDDDADHLLRVLSDPEARVERARLRRRFSLGMQASGQARSATTQLWDELVAELPVAPSRAACLAAVTGGLRCLLLRMAEPAAFFATLLAEPAGAWPLHVRVSEAVRLGVALRGPCVQEGEVETRGGDGVLRVGLEQVRGVRRSLCLEVISHRRMDGPFEGLADLMARLPASDDEVEALIAAGALDGLPGAKSRTDLRLLHRHLRPHRSRPRTGRRRRAKPPPPPAAPPSTEDERLSRRAALLRDELAALGFTVSGHPLQIAAPELKAAGVTVAGLAPPDGIDLACNDGPGGEAGPEGPAVIGPTRDGDVVELTGWLVAGRPAGPPPPDLRWWTVFDTPRALIDAAIPDRLVRGVREPPSGPCLLKGRIRSDGGLSWLDVLEIRAIGEGLGYAESA